MGDDFVALDSRFTSGWPWPESSWGLDPMYGEAGWCHACGVPAAAQTGSMVLRRAKFPTSAFWMPNWRFDALCVRLAEARHIVEHFDLITLPITTPKVQDTGFVQLLPEVSAEPWFAPDELSSIATMRHGSPGAECRGCGTWRWLPIPTREQPAATIRASVGVHFVASPEWFGDGFKAMRAIRVSRPLAQQLVALNPRVWSIQEPVQAEG